MSVFNFKTYKLSKVANNYIRFLNSRNITAKRKDIYRNITAKRKDIYRNIKYTLCFTWLLIISNL